MNGIKIRRFWDEKETKGTRGQASFPSRQHHHHKISPCSTKKIKGEKSRPFFSLFPPRGRSLNVSAETLNSFVPRAILKGLNHSAQGWRSSAYPG
jgi:hypothetical protein